MIALYQVTYDPTSPTPAAYLTNVAQGDTVRVSARSLALAFDKDRRRANRVFANHLCVVTGRIVEINGNWLGEPIVYLEGDRSKNVSLIFQKTEQGHIDLLEIGETISVLGICVGEQPRYGIQVKQCILVTRAETPKDTPGP